VGVSDDDELKENCVMDLFTSKSPIYAENFIFHSLIILLIKLSDTEESSDKSSSDNKKRSKGKVREIKEETQITNDFAHLLDLSCMSKGLVKAPNITNGYIAKYNR
jgi:hypothetical protein